MNTQTTNVDLDDPAQSGVYLVTDEDLQQIAHTKHAEDTCLRQVNLCGYADKLAVLAELARALDFPTGFDPSRDALADRLLDLSWLPAQSYVLLLSGMQDLHDAQAHDFDMLLDMLDATAASWAQAQIPFFSFVALRVDKSQAPIVTEEDFHLRGEYIELNQLLKLTGICDSGGAGKALVASGTVQVDGRIELRKTCKIRVGQRVTVHERHIHVLIAPTN